MINTNELSNRIYDFIDRYAIKDKKYSGDDESKMYLSPEPYELLVAADFISKGIMPKFIEYDFDNGSYSKEGREEYLFIINELKALKQRCIQKGGNFIKG